MGYSELLGLGGNRVQDDAAIRFEVLTDHRRHVEAFRILHHELSGAKGGYALIEASGGNLTALSAGEGVILAALGNAVVDYDVFAITLEAVCNGVAQAGLVNMGVSNEIHVVITC